jgi:hypothetical protein
MVMGVKFPPSLKLWRDEEGKKVKGRAKALNAETQRARRKDEKGKTPASKCAAGYPSSRRT